MDYKDALKNITKSCCDICKDDKGNILIIKKKEEGNDNNNNNNNNNGNNANSKSNDEATATTLPETLPELCNEFYTDFMESNQFFGINSDDEKNEIIEIIQHFCIWLFKNDYTKSKLSLAQ